MMVNGVRLTCDPSGALWWPERRTLVLADLHLEKGSGLAAAGAGLLPPYDTRATLGRIAMLFRRYRPAATICLGDSFHDGEAGERLSEEDAIRLRRLTAATDWIWIEGNHDPEPPRHLGGRVLA
ncbi:MAG TPA: metallophosphoesterase, partial [Candidatus Sulfotelmatobacter sp.]|nr:metallophosphoesterase [Candidatus Sulfotelmatobacter sp.]